MHVLLYQPEIPPNTGNVARLCAATGCELHLIEPLGFRLEDRYLKRAGLDYWPEVTLSVWPDLAAYLRGPGQGRRLVLTSARQGHAVHRFSFSPDDTLVMGRETSGLPPDVQALSPHRVRIPIRGAVRSLNLATATGIVLYQALAACGELDRWETDAHNALVCTDGGTDRIDSGGSESAESKTSGTACHRTAESGTTPENRLGTGIPQLHASADSGPVDENRPGAAARRSTQNGVAVSEGLC